MNRFKRRFMERNVVRRKTDHSLIRQNERLNRLYKMGQIITSEWWKPIIQDIWIALPGKVAKSTRHPAMG